MVPYTAVYTTVWTGSTSPPHVNRANFSIDRFFCTGPDSEALVTEKVLGRYNCNIAEAFEQTDCWLSDLSVAVPE